MASSDPSFIPYRREACDQEAMRQRASILRHTMEQRRSLRMFDPCTIPREVLQDLLATAASAPSGANKQPWCFCVVTNPEMKQRIRQAAEKEEYENYHGRMSATWLQDIEPMGTDWEKPFLEEAPALIVVFKQIYGRDEAGQQSKHYYVNESVGLACGFLISAIHQVGLVTLTHTPSPMDFLARLLERPANEKPYLLLPVGYPHPEATVPVLARKPVKEQIAWYE